MVFAVEPRLQGVGVGGFTGDSAMREWGWGWGAWPDLERELAENGHLAAPAADEHQLFVSLPPPTRNAGLHPHTHEGQDVRLPQSVEPSSTRRRQEGDEDHVVSSPMQSR